MCWDTTQQWCFGSLKSILLSCNEYCNCFCSHLRSLPPPAPRSSARYFQSRTAGKTIHRLNVMQHTATLQAILTRNLKNLSHAPSTVPCQSVAHTRTRDVSTQQPARHAFVQGRTLSRMQLDAINDDRLAQEPVPHQAPGVLQTSIIWCILGKLFCHWHLDTQYPSSFSTK